MIQNKIYQNFIFQILKNFFVFLFIFSIIALTVRAVNFLDLIIDSGYPVSTYFTYSLLNLFGLIPKFIPLSFLISLMIFILKHNDGEFIILWTSGVKKIFVVNLFLTISIIILIIYLILTTIVTPLALNKSRQLLSNDSINSFLPTIKTQQFSDSFKNFTFIVENKSGNELQHIFLHDKGNNFKNLSSNLSQISETTILAENGIVEENKMFLFNGQIISSKKNNENEIIKFDQLNINLGSLSTTTIKKPKIQETSTLKLIGCLSNNPINEEYCNKNFQKEVLPTLNRRIIIPLYIPVLSLICALLLIKTKKIYLGKISVFLYGFLLLLFTELAVRYTGLSKIILYFFMSFPFLLIFFFYSYLSLTFSKESKSSWIK